MRIRKGSVADIVLNDVNESNYEEFIKAYDEVTEMVERRFNRKRANSRKRRMMLLGLWR